MKKLYILTLLLLSNYCYSQVLTLDSGANAQLATLNTSIATLITLNSSTEVSVANDLTESISQGEQLIEQYEQVQEIQEQLETVTGYVKSFNTLNKALDYSMKTFTSFRNVISKISNIESFDDTQVNTMIELFNSLLEENTDMVDKLRKLLTDSGIKTDDGTRLLLLEDYEKIIIKNYNKINSIEKYIEMIFPNNELIND